MTTRRLFVAALAASVVAPRLSFAQTTGKVYRIGHLSGSGADASKGYMEAFRRGLRDHGFVEKRDYVLEERYAEGKFDRLPALIQELIAAKCDAWLIATTPGNVAAKAANSTVPHVMVLIADPIGAGVVTNLARPGGNITGVTNLVSELAGKRLEILKEIVPHATRVAVFVNTSSQNAPLQLKVAENAARGLGIQLRTHAVTTPAELKPAFEAAVKSGAQAAIRMIDGLALMLREDTVRLAASYRLPFMHVYREDVEAGGLIAYSVDITDQFRQAATFIYKIAKGAKPGDLPVEQPAKFELVVNRRAAQAIGLSLPQALLLRADKVID